MEKKLFQKSEAINVLILGFFSILIPTLFFHAWDGILIALFLYFTFNFFLKRYDSLIFSLSFGLYLISSTFFLISTYYINGTPFLAGGDDTFFYLAGKQLYISGFDIQTEIDGFPLWATNYPAYLYLISSFYGFLSWFGFDSLHFYHLTLLKISLGALIPVLIHKIGNNLSAGFSRSSILFIILFPALVIQTASFLRDSLITFFFIFGAYITTKKINIFYKLLLILILSSIIYFFRPVHTVFLIILFCSYLLFSSKTLFWVKISISIIVLLTLFGFIKLGYSDLFEQFTRVQNMYSELSLETSRGGSLGIKLYSSNSPFLWPIKLIYYFSSPIPPPFFGEQNILTFYTSVGSISWYLIVYAFLKSIFRKGNLSDSFFVCTYILFILAGIIGVSTSKDPRHLTFIYPLIIPYGLRELGLIDKSKLYFFFILFTSFGLLAYILLKILL